MNVELAFDPADNFAAMPLTKELYGKWTPLHTVCLQQWTLSLLLRVTELPAALSRAVVVAKHRSSVNEARTVFNDWYEELTQDKDLFLTFKTVHMHQPVDVLWPQEYAQVNHFVVCAGCQRCPIAHRVFVCDVCEQCTLCVHCFTFHNPTHRLSVIGAEPDAYPNRELRLPGGEMFVGVEEKPEDSSDENLEVWKILEIVSGRTVKSQQQYNVKWSVGSDSLPFSEWVSREQLIGGHWFLSPPHDDTEFLTAALNAVNTPEKRRSSLSTGSKKRKSNPVSASPVPVSASPVPVSASVPDPVCASPLPTSAPENSAPKM